MPEKENLTARVEIKLTPTDKARLEQYATDHYMKLAQVIKKFLFEGLEKENY